MWLKTAVLAGLLSQGTSVLAATNAEIFEKQLKPVLVANCQSCHSGEEPAGGLKLTTVESLLAGGKHGQAVVPGNSADSLVIQYVRGLKAPKMPLGGALSDTAVKAMAAAIDEMKPVATLSKAGNPYIEWLSKKPAAPAVPSVKMSSWVKNPIDAFVLQKLEGEGLRPAPAADKRTLLRRLYFDLIGLPPTPDDLDAFISDPDPNAYEKLVAKLLDDPRYGERWARHWLDLVRFAESDGFAIDGERPTAWRYRDYVIRAFNQDKPYDLFIKEQLAGDELTDKRAGDRSERLVALGYLRMGTWEADANFKTQLRQDFLNDVTATTSQVFLGLTTGCARCHDHKYDPIPQKDFYRLQAFFAATRPEERAAPHLPVENPKRLRQMLRDLEDSSEEAADHFKKLETDYKNKFIAAKHLAPGDKMADDFRKALKDKDPIFTAAEREAYETSRDDSRRKTEALARYRATAYSVSDVVPPQVPVVADTYLLAGGELGNKGEKVEPGFLQCLTGNADPATIPYTGGSSGRRLALAEWIASAENPLTARVMANRMWQHHFGEGIVRTSSDWGLNGDRATHPELLDWLATQFIESKWSMKAMHKLILTSNTYRQASENREVSKAGKDVANRLLSRQNWKRLEAEALRDSILQVSGRIQKSAGGPGVFLSIPADVAEGFEFFKWFPSDQNEQLRRTIYTFQRRSVMLPMVEVFDGANMNESCSRRSVTTVPTQALSLLNSEFTSVEAKHFAQRVIELAGPDRSKQLERAFQLALNRDPTPQEREKSAQVLGELPAAEALTRLAVVLFNLNEFVYVN